MNQSAKPIPEYSVPEHSDSEVAHGEALKPEVSGWLHCLWSRRKGMGKVLFYGGGLLILLFLITFTIPPTLHFKQVFPRPILAFVAQFFTEPRKVFTIAGIGMMGVWLFIFCLALYDQWNHRKRTHAQNANEST